MYAIHVHNINYTPCISYIHVDLYVNAAFICLNIHNIPSGLHACFHERVCRCTKIVLQSVPLLLNSPIALPLDEWNPARYLLQITGSSCECPEASRWEELWDQDVSYWSGQWAGPTSAPGPSSCGAECNHQTNHRPRQGTGEVVLFNIHVKGARRIFWIGKHNINCTRSAHGNFVGYVDHAHHWPRTA